MQLTLTFLEDLPAQPMLSDQLDPQALVEAGEILARIIAQAITQSEQKETTDE
jgi:hypothetical protein